MDNKRCLRTMAPLLVYSLVLLLLPRTSAFAFGVNQVPFDDLVKQASVILIGTVERNQPRSRFPEWSDVKVETVLKGSVPTSVRVESHGLVAELSVRMTAGRRYFFLLTKKGDLYVSVHGHFGVIPVDGKPLYSK